MASKDGRGIIRKARLLSPFIMANSRGGYTSARPRLFVLLGARLLSGLCTTAISTTVGDGATGAKLCQAARCCIGDEVRISKFTDERSSRRSIFNRLYGRRAIFLRRPGNGTGPIGEGERIGGFAEHISGSHEIRFYGRQASGNELVAGERKRGKIERERARGKKLETKTKYTRNVHVTIKRNEGSGGTVFEGDRLALLLVDSTLPGGSQFSGKFH